MLAQRNDQSADEEADAGDTRDGDERPARHCVPVSERRLNPSPARPGERERRATQGGGCPRRKVVRQADVVTEREHWVMPQIRGIGDETDGDERGARQNGAPEGARPEGENQHGADRGSEGKDARESYLGL